ncbi:cytochrome P450 [Modestobacter excelsi]|uniref:cytochrome P450 n=1 Tax=Modestobacter excelsi TaxID=2213161 RepID=UPI001C20DA4A|nr:cytochrome P450 [Modestobacter excelsi]
MTSVQVSREGPDAPPPLLVDEIRRHVAVRLAGVLSWNRVAGLGAVRRRRPLTGVGRSLVVVTRQDDVDEVLDRTEVFAFPYAHHLPGEFLLGSGPVEHRRQRAELDAVLRCEDADRLRRMAADEAETQVERAHRAGRMDVVSGLVQPVLDVVLDDYVGTPGPDPEIRRQWARDLFEHIFLNRGEIPLVAQRAEVAGRQMDAHLASLMVEIRKDPGGPDTLLRRLVEREGSGHDCALDDAEIRGNVIGMAIGWLWHGARAAVLGLDGLLTRPRALELAREAARDGDLEQLRRLLWEVFRFRPVQPRLPRRCTAETMLAEGTPRALRVRTGAAVFVGTHSAMWDETAVPDPEDFDATRDRTQYRVFGGGPHRCPGEDVMGVQLPALLAPLLRSDGLRRVPGSAGCTRWDGLYPRHLAVDLGEGR